MTMIQAKDVHYDYLQYTEDNEKPEVKHALKGIDLEVKKGQFIAVIGPNGCGKSTFAKHINALLIPSEGSVFVEQIDTKDQTRVWDIRQKAGMVFQNPDNQIIASVVEEDVAFGPENIGVPTEEIWKRVDNALALTGMTAYREKSPNKLSGGQKQRVAIAGVMAMKPECIVLDEPTAMLDPEGRKEVMAAMKELNREQGVTIILITHYMEEIVDADMIFVLENGRVSMSGKPEYIFTQVDELKRAGLDVPQVTELAHELKKAGVDIKEPVLTVEEMAEALCR
ncbi:MAG: energy-coupling factor transporter ATPase [Lachnospiraceae bacterium]|nr:energy-coupling factor transporter ATPase [Lachnospiraceae bacterium]MDY6221471.1 energy-coupling factor transporter ATPase [Candidatus Alectryocaccobium sp.]